MNIEQKIQEKVEQVIEKLYGEVDEKLIQITKTRKEFEGDYTLVVFPLLKISKKNPEQTAQEIGEQIIESCEQVESYNIIKGFLNLVLKSEVWVGRLNTLGEKREPVRSKNSKKVMVEYSSPNTNKPLHLGHIRNNLLGYSIAEIIKADGREVVKVNLVNDRGIHICKSMLAWQRFGDGETPKSSGMKGDHLVGKYYVRFDKEYKKQIAELVESGQTEERAKQEAEIIVEAQEMLRGWEAKDPKIRELWEMMNGWVYEGFEQTYKALGVDFDKIYYESETYLLGKEIVEIGLKKNILFKKEDGSVWVDLTEEGLDQKLLLRGDGTSVYMTQDLGTALQRVEEYDLDRLIYVVGNEQIYHFQVLKLILKKLGYDWADVIYHLSYGMVELPEGRMKSREGTVVDADDLIEDMVATARQMSQELGKTEGMTEEQIDKTSRMVAMGALKYFILKVDPKKTMVFDPKESIDFNGNTGPFIQYTHARIRSLIRRAEEQKIGYEQQVEMAIERGSEIELIKLLNDYEDVVEHAAAEFSPSVIAMYVYDLAKEFNSFYQDSPILKEENLELRAARLKISSRVASVIKSGMKLLGIEVPEKM